MADGNFPGGTSPDGSSIVTDNQGKLATGRPSSLVIGDWDSGVGSWSLQDASRTTESGNSVIQINATGSGKVERTMDVTEYEEAAFRAKPNTQFKIGVGSADKNIQHSGYKTVVIDISHLTGDQRIYGERYDDGGYIDWIQLRKNQRKTVDSGAGN